MDRSDPTVGRRSGVLPRSGMAIAVAPRAAWLLAVTLTLAQAPPPLGAESIPDEAARRPTLSEETLLDLGYREMYNLEFDAAHASFARWKATRPDDPLGPASDAAAYLFAELDRLSILQTEFFVDDDNFLNPKKLVADPARRKAFFAEIEAADALGDKALEHAPNDTNALFAKVIAAGLRADFEALIDKENLRSLATIKRGRGFAETLLKLDPDAVDAHLAIGVENYMLSLRAAPLRWLMRLGGAETNREKGLERLRVVAERGRYLRPYARLLLAVAARRDGDTERARTLLADLAREFPKNRLYRDELAMLGPAPPAAPSPRP